MANVSHQLRDFAHRYTAAWCSQDPGSVADHYSPSGSLSINGGNPAIGRIAITDVARAFMTSFPDLQVIMESLITKGDRAEYHWTLLGTNSGPGGTGQRVRISGFEEWKIGKDGLIEESKGQYDGALYQRQLEHGGEEPRADL
jgi:hypothetical protein